MKITLRLYVSAIAVVSFLSILAAARLSAAGPPEAILSDRSVAYMRFDGLKKHEEGMGKTVLGDIVSQHLQPLIDHIHELVMDEMGPEVLSENLLGGASPEELLELQKVSAGLPQAIEYLYAHGLVAGVEVEAQPQAEPRWQVTLVVPDAAEGAVADALLGLIRLIAMVEQRDLETQQIDGREVIGFEHPDANLAGWKEDAHVVWAIGTLDVERTIARAAGDDPGLASTDGFQAFGTFDRYPTYARGYIDTHLIAQVVQEVFPPAQDIVKQFGIDGLKRFAFHAGYDGKYQRSTILLNMPGERNGVLQLVDGLKPVRPDNLPPISPDATYVVTSGMDVQPAYDTVLTLIQLAFRFSGQGGGDEIRERLEEIEKQLGVSIRDDILSEVEEPMVVYSAPSEGPLSMGSVILLKVKDEQKLTARLDTLLKSLGPVTGEDIHVKTSRYRDAFIRSVRIGKNVPFMPTYTVHKGWLAVSLFPQPIQGYVLRSEGGYRTWKPTPLVAEVLQKENAYRSQLEKKVVGISQSDPRPTISELLSVTPLFGMMASAYGGGEEPSFDFSLIPNAQAINEHVVPGVTVTIDDGEDLRVETYASLPIGFQLTGMQSYYMGLAPLFLFRAF